MYYLVLKYSFVSLNVQQTITIFYCIYCSDPVPVEKLDKWFCFAQSTSSGKVLGVFYGKGEEEWVVNFKKSIASAFQANYEGTAVTNETNSQSKHTSHYKLVCILMHVFYVLVS